MQTHTHAYTHAHTHTTRMITTYVNVYPIGNVINDNQYKKQSYAYTHQRTREVKRYPHVCTRSVYTIAH